MKKRKCRLILIEDSETDAELLMTYMKKNKIYAEVELLDNGEKALQKLQSYCRHPDPEGPEVNFVILDLSLPKMNGKEILRELQNSGDLSAAHVLVFSGSTNPDDKKTCLQAGAKGYYSKPWDSTGYRSFVLGPLADHLRETCPCVFEAS